MTSVSLPSALCWSLPLSLKLGHCRYYVDRLGNDCYSNYGIELPISLQSAVAKRRCEFLAGRVLAIAMLKQLGCGDVVIARGKLGAPVWPTPYIGSISHADGVAVCAVGKKPQHRRIGIDIETLITSATSEEISALVINKGERKLLSDTGCLPFEELLTIVFSAKESLYKALCPSVGRFFSFEDAQIYSLDCDSQVLTLVLTADLTEDYPAGLSFTCHFKRFADKIVTLLCD